mmetsp:Transcript_38313/g.28218  ORF Transcript_38313/g.28218 Transcript_38313/m.28218 type:complete len:97 (+) Transcript_38313:77-367(+)
MEESKETYFEKAVRKCTNEPLVPIGALVTTAFLVQGLRAFHSGQKKVAQQLMRGRVVAQMFTVIAMGFGAYAGFRPSSNPKNIEHEIERKQQSAQG